MPRFATREHARCKLPHVNVLAYLDIPTVGQPEAFIQSKDGLLDASGAIGPDSRKYFQNWIEHYALWVKKHAG